jgi:hypothetical protein
MSYVEATPRAGIWAVTRTASFPTKPSLEGERFPKAEADKSGTSRSGRAEPGEALTALWKRMMSWPYPAWGRSH